MASHSLRHLHNLIVLASVSERTVILVERNGAIIKVGAAAAGARVRSQARHIVF